MPSMVWMKTDAGRTEMQSRALVKERAQRNLLLLIDGTKSEQTLLASVAGVSADDLRALESLGLIAPVATRSTSASAEDKAPPAAERSAEPAEAAPAGEALSYSEFTTVLTQLISRELGLRGFPLTLAVERASNPEELRDVAQRVLAQIRERKGEAVAEQARRSLFGG